MRKKLPFFYICFIWKFTLAGCLFNFFHFWILLRTHIPVWAALFWDRMLICWKRNQFLLVFSFLTSDHKESFTHFLEQRLTRFGLTSTRSSAPRCRQTPIQPQRPDWAAWRGHAEEGGSGSFWLLFFFFFTCWSEIPRNALGCEWTYWLIFILFFF